MRYISNLLNGEAMKMNKTKLKLIVMLVPIIIGVITLSGCVGPFAIQTKHWDHLNTEGSAVTLWG